MIYHCSGCFSDRKWVGNGSDSVPSGPIGTDLSDQNPVGQIGQIPYYLGGPVFQNFRSENVGTDKTSANHIKGHSKTPKYSQSNLSCFLMCSYRVALLW